MKTMTKAALAMLALGASTWVAVAQPFGGPGARGAQSPIFLALDTNHDGVIDANEIANAPAALRTLLKDGSTNLTAEDLFGPPQRMGGRGGRGGFAGPGQFPGRGGRGFGGRGGPDGFGGQGGFGGPGGFNGPGGDDGPQAFDVGDQNVRCLDHLDRQGRVAHVR